MQRLRFLNPVMDSEFKKALETLALSHDTQKKAVSISFAGEGKRQVQVGYVVENPIWKTSYRLVLGTKKEEKPYLQGWAVVENPTDEDWKDVRMALVSGRPISFQMDLYQPLFVNRPVVEPELFASLRPVAYSGGMDGDGPARWPTASEPAGQAERAPECRRDGRGIGGEGKAADGEARAGRRARRPTPARLGEQLEGAAEPGRERVGRRRRRRSWATSSSTRSTSRSACRGRSRPCCRSSARTSRATRVCIYNERTQAKFPLLGLQVQEHDAACT